MRATAVAHPNIALVKYWGKRDRALNLPAAGSLSMTLGGLSTRTEVIFDPMFDRDALILDDQPVESGRALERVTRFLDLVRERAGAAEMRARVRTANDFPTAAGLASSASGFAALALAATRALHLDLSPSQLSALARRGSGSAARSLFGGFVRMHAGSAADGHDAVAEPLAPASHWDLRCLVAVTARGPKAVGSTTGMQRTEQSSPYYDAWVDSVDADLEAASEAVDARDLTTLGRIAERSCLRMHASAMAADPGILYFNAATVGLIHRVRQARQADGLPAFFTIDAGPHVKVFCPAEAAGRVEALLRETDGVLDVLGATPGGDARLIEEA